MSRSRLLLVVPVAAAIILFFATGAQRHLSFENAKAQQAGLQALYQSDPWRTVLGYFAAYVATPDCRCRARRSSRSSQAPFSACCGERS